ncbi:DNA-binding protein HU-beta [Arenibacter algicola]|jgi:DNA-binding protein HU-beta|uniref:DNA-binding protein HU n=4 Tax=Arenibacter TaxID=178469 RepID=A0A221UT57_9FLAO|nr:DNA-binding protein HU [Arenibacter algicola]GBF18261.1 DNA-binding protein HU [Arenibacter sp. NBRC 103722]SHE65244.1 DNA-binding protein HU-beta [Arenibacter palladensis]SMG31486.1 DNA-binding protein HU-beta [Arenibacter troitsensis]|tara:strand:- start:2425 stop:2820 length:396 start_codon:yes stop_codon:yes gene_type:complete
MVYPLKIKFLSKERLNLIHIFASRKKNSLEIYLVKMTKAEIVTKISEKLGIEKGDVQATVESFMDEVKTSLESGDNVYLRGFGSFIIKTRAEKTGRNISKNTTIKIPAHNIPAFKPAKVFVEGVKSNVQVK